MKRLIIIAGAAVLVTGAQAGTFVANWSYTSVANIATTSGTVGATKFTAVRTGGTDTLLNWGAGGSYMTFCAELNEHIGSGGNTFQNVILLNGSGTQSTLATGTVFNFARTNALEKLWGWALTSGLNFSDNTNIWAFQLAQWNLLFDANVDFSASGGLWKATSGPTNVISTADTFLSTASTYTGQRAALYLMQGYNPLTGGAGLQDQITGTLSRPPGGNTVPEPFTMGLGIAAAGAFVRRRMKAKRA